MALFVVYLLDVHAARRLAVMKERSVGCATEYRSALGSIGSATVVCNATAKRVFARQPNYMYKHIETDTASFFTYRCGWLASKERVMDGGGGEPWYMNAAFVCTIGIMICVALSFLFLTAFSVVRVLLLPSPEESVRMIAEQMLQETASKHTFDVRAALTPLQSKAVEIRQSFRRFSAAKSRLQRVRGCRCSAGLVASAASEPSKGQRQHLITPSFSRSDDVREDPEQIPGVPSLVPGPSMTTTAAASPYALIFEAAPPEAASGTSDAEGPAPNPTEADLAEATEPSKPSNVILTALRRALLRDMGRVLDLFRSLDLDGNGVVTRAEFRAVLPMLLQRMAHELKTKVVELPLASSLEDEMDEIFTSLDTDGSGHIEYRELNAALRQGQSSGWGCASPDIIQRRPKSHNLDKRQRMRQKSQQQQQQWQQQQQQQQPQQPQPEPDQHQQTPTDVRAAPLTQESAEYKEQPEERLFLALFKDSKVADKQAGRDGHGMAIGIATEMARRSSGPDALAPSHHPTLPGGPQEIQVVWDEDPLPRSPIRRLRSPKAHHLKKARPVAWAAESQARADLEHRLAECERQMILSQETRASPRTQRRLHCEWLEVHHQEQCQWEEEKEERRHRAREGDEAVDSRLGDTFNEANVLTRGMHGPPRMPMCRAMRDAKRRVAAIGYHGGTSLDSAVPSTLGVLPLANRWFERAALSDLRTWRVAGNAAADGSVSEDGTAYIDIYTDDDDDDDDDRVSSLSSKEAGNAYSKSPLFLTPHHDESELAEEPRVREATMQPKGMPRGSVTATSEDKKEDEPRRQQQQGRHQQVTVSRDRQRLSEASAAAAAAWDAGGGGAFSEMEWNLGAARRPGHAR